MDFNPIKCVVLTITHKVNPIRTSYSLYGQELNQVHQAKYLGLIQDSRLTFNKHIECICKRANSALHLLEEILISARGSRYLLYLRETNFNINKLESVQRRAVRYVMSDFDRYSSISEKCY